MSSFENNNTSSGDGTGVFDVLIDVSLTALAVTVGCKFVLNLMGYHWFNYSIKQIRNAVKVPISDLRSIAQSPDNPLVMVSGYIKPLSPDSPPIISQVSGREAVFLQISNLGSSLFTRTVRITHQVPFVLFQKGSSDSTVVVNMNEYQGCFVDFTTVNSPTGSLQVQEKMLLLGDYFNAIGNVTLCEDGTPQIKVCKTFTHFLSYNGLVGIEIDLIHLKSYFGIWTTIYGSIFACLLIYIIFLRKKPRWAAFLQRRRQAPKQSKKKC